MFIMANETIVEGYGKDKKAAIKDAEKTLPYRMNDIDRYESIHVRGYSQEGDRWKVTVGYTLPEQSKTRQTRAATSTRGTGPAADSDAVTLMRQLPRR